MHDAGTGRLTWPRVRIDPNDASEEGYCVARVSDASADVNVGDEVTAYEAEDGVAWAALVRRVANGFIYLDVDWATMTEEAPLNQSITFVHPPGLAFVNSNRFIVAAPRLTTPLNAATFGVLSNAAFGVLNAAPGILPLGVTDVTLPLSLADVQNAWGTTAVSWPFWALPPALRLSFTMQHHDIPPAAVDVASLLPAQNDSRPNMAGAA